MPEQAPKKRRRRGLSLRVLMAAVLVIGSGLGWLSHSARVQRLAVAALEEAGASVVYNWGDPAKPPGSGQTGPPYPRWAVDALGPDFFGHVVQVNYLGGDRRFGDEQLASVGRLSRLDSVWIQGSNVTDAGLAHLRDLTRLNRLGLCWNKGVTDGGLVHLRGLENLEALYLIETGVEGPGLAQLARLSRLNDLQIATVAPTDKNMAALSRMKSLKALVLSGERLSDAGLAPLAGLANLESLQFGGAQCRGITTAGMVHLAALKRLGFLTLDRTRVDSLQHFKGLSSLKYLSLQQTPIGDAGLAFARNLDRLDTLNLSDSQVSDAGLAHLASLKHLTTLHLFSTNVSDAGVPELSRLTKLTVLGIDQTKITAEGVAKLREALPSTNLLWYGDVATGDVAK
jgi:internalin A